VAWNRAGSGRPDAFPAHALFEAAVDRAPAAAALDHAGGVVRYAELDARSNRLAHHLGRLGVGPESLVGLAMERSVDLVVAVLGVLKAGAAWVPLDPTYPRERLAFMVEDARPALVLAGPGAPGDLAFAGAR